MLKILERNWNAIQRFRPELYESLKSTYEEFSLDRTDYPNERFEWISTAEGMNFRYTRKDPAIDVIYHQPSPQKESEMVLGFPQIAGSNLILFWGFGLGHSFKNFLDRRTQNNFVVCIVESNPRIFLRSLCVHDFTTALEDPSIFFAVSPDIASIAHSMFPIPYLYPTAIGTISGIIQPGAMACDRDFYTACEKELKRSLQHGVSSFGNDINDQLFGLANTIDNLPHSLNSPGLNLLMNQFKGMPIISVASGPSLDGHWDLLKSVQRKIPIIACDTASHRLIQKGIIPDFITALEREKYVAKCFAEVTTPQESTLIAPTMLLKDAFDSFHGVKALYSAGINRFNHLFSIDELGILMPGHSAGNLNIAAACKMGFKTIILIGHNLGFAPGSLKTHYQGIGDAREEPKTLEEQAKIFDLFKTICQDETEEVYTSTSYDLFRIQIEHYIKVHSDVRVINLAKKGAKIKGTETMSFQEAVEPFLKNPLNITARTAEIFGAFDISVARGRYERALKRCRHAVTSLKTVKVELGFLFQKLGERMNKLEATEKKGGAISLEELDPWLDEILKFKLKSIEDKYFQESFFSIIIPLHIQFERALNTMPGRYQDDYSLKRDILKAHRDEYFPVWLEYLPKVLKEFERAVNLLEVMPGFTHQKPEANSQSFELND